jgi:hypothetical protein
LTQRKIYTLTRPLGTEIKDFLPLSVHPLRGGDVVGFSHLLRSPEANARVNEATRSRYRRYIANDIATSKLGPLPLAALTNADVAQWLNGLKGSAKIASDGGAKGTRTPHRTWGNRL